MRRQLKKKDNDEKSTCVLLWHEGALEEELQEVHQQEVNE